MGISLTQFRHWVLNSRLVNASLIPPSAFFSPESTFYLFSLVQFLLTGRRRRRDDEGQTVRSCAINQGFICPTIILKSSFVWNLSDNPNPASDTICQLWKYRRRLNTVLCTQHRSECSYVWWRQQMRWQQTKFPSSSPTRPRGLHTHQVQPQQGL